MSYRQRQTSRSGDVLEKVRGSINDMVDKLEDVAEADAAEKKKTFAIWSLPTRTRTRTSARLLIRSSLRRIIPRCVRGTYFYICIRSTSGSEKRTF